MTPESVAAYLLFVAGEVRQHLAGLGVRSFADAVGRADLLRLVLSSRGASTVAPALSSMMIYLLMAIVLVVRPAGLFPVASK